MFVSVQAGSVLLDCVVAPPPWSGASTASVGLPFSVEASLPPAEWALFARALLDRWAADGTVVDVELRRDWRGPRVLVSDGEARILLDLRVPAGM